MASFNLLTISSGSVTEGAQVTSLTLKGAGVTIPAILVGESGRGREVGALPVQLTSTQEAEWQEKGTVAILAAEVGQTRAGKPKLFARETATTDEKVICVFRTPIGFRGGNSHTGDRMGEHWTLDHSGREGCRILGLEPRERYSREEVLLLSKRLYEAANPGTPSDDLREDACFDRHLVFATFPGEKLVTGTIAQGAAGRAGSGEQMVAVLPRNVVFRTTYSGRLYGSPAAHYYKWNGGRLLAATWDERVVSDLF